MGAPTVSANCPQAECVPAVTHLSPNLRWLETKSIFQVATKTCDSVRTSEPMVMSDVDQACLPKPDLVVHNHWHANSAKVALTRAILTPPIGTQSIVALFAAAPLYAVRTLRAVRRRRLLIGRCGPSIRQHVVVACELPELRTGLGRFKVRPILH